MKIEDKITLSLKRKKIVERLIAGTSDRTELVNEVDVSRSTVYRALDDLEDKGLVETRGGEYKVTQMGEVLHRAVNQLVHVTEAVDTLSTVVEGECLRSLPVETLSESSIITPSRCSPKRHLKRICNLISASQSIEIILPILTPAIVRSVATCSQDTHIEVTVSEKVFKYLSSTPVDEQTKAFLSSIDDLRVINSCISYAVFLFREPESTIALLFYDRCRANVAVIDNSDETYEWAQETYDDHVSDAVTADYPSTIGEDEVE